MTDEPTAHPREPEAASERTAAQVAAMVAEQVREAIQSAERSADELQREARDRAAGDLTTVRPTAAEVLSRIDTVEAKVGTLLQTLRDEVARTIERAERAEVARTTEQAERAEVTDHEHAVTSAIATPPDGPPPSTPSPQRWRLFGRRHRSVVCAVCGRAPRPAEQALEGWRRTGELRLCPDCQRDGWQLPPGARLPYRPAQHADG